LIVLLGSVIALLPLLILALWGLLLLHAPVLLPVVLPKALCDVQPAWLLLELATWH
jgi:hypothetical protein